MSVYPVTNEQYACFVSKTGRAAPAAFADRRFNDPAQPVVTVNWNHARAFTAWLFPLLDGPVARLPITMTISSWLLRRVHSSTWTTSGDRGAGL